MKHELFVEQPCIDLKKGIRVTKTTELLYKNDMVEQVLKDMILETIMDSQGTHGANSFTSKSYIHLSLNEGDILLFDETRGYYLPGYPMTTIEDAISDISSLEGMGITEEQDPVQQ